MMKLKQMVPVLMVCAATSAALAQGGQGQPPQPPAPPSLSQMDGDHDGRVTVAEADAFFSKMGQDHAGTRPSAPPDAGEKPPQSADGQPRRPPEGRAGAKGQPPKPPSGAQMDSNRDGVISQAEFDAMLKAMPQPPVR